MPDKSSPKYTLETLEYLSKMLFHHDILSKLYFPNLTNVDFWKIHCRVALLSHLKNLPIAPPARFLAIPPE